MTRSTVVIASRLFPPEVSAGAFRLGALAQAVVQRGHEMRVLTTTPSRHAPPIDDPVGVTVQRWPVLRDRGGNVRGYAQYASFDAPLIGRLLCTRFDVVVAESPPTTGLVVAFIAWLKRRPFAYYAADVWTDGVISMGAPKIVVNTVRWMERRVLRRASSIISVSDEVTERLLELDADIGRVVTVGNGIDTDVFSEDVEPLTDESYFVYTGTMSEWQRPEIFVRAFALLADAYPGLRLRFFGQGVVEEDIRAVAEELVPGRVSFGGIVSPAESARWLRGAVGAVVSIAPGIGYDFARPTKTYAAAATGTPVLFAGPETGAGLVTDAGLGVATAFTPEAVADGMRSLLADAADGTRERKRVERAAWARANVSLTALGDRVADAVIALL